MNNQERVDAIDRLIKTYRGLIFAEQKTIDLIEAGAYFHRSNIVDITAETQVAAKQRINALRQGIQAIELSRADLIK